MIFRNSIFCFLLLIFCSQIRAQLPVRLPNDIRIISNDSTLIIDKPWIDTLVSHAKKPNFAHSISAYHVDDDTKKVFTKIRLPQTFSRLKIVECIILYYGMLSSEKERENEFLLIYPYFTAITDSPDVTCKYDSGGRFNIHFYNWETIPRPAEPSKEEKEIFNRVLDASFSVTSSMDKIPGEVFEQIADSSKIEMKKVIEIYRRVFLWQKTCQ